MRLSSIASGTSEYLVDKNGNHYFMEVNPRVQVEHAVTKEIVGINTVQLQILIASGKTLPRLVLTQDAIPYPKDCATQCRVKTEDPSQEFCADTEQSVCFVGRRVWGFGSMMDRDASLLSSIRYSAGEYQIGDRIEYCWGTGRMDKRMKNGE